MHTQHAWPLLAALPLLLAGASARAEEIRDYYAEPGLNPQREPLSQGLGERIDQFGGSLQLSYTDVLVPGNGGLALAITRAYTSLQDSLGARSPIGVGWSMHFGRIVVPARHADKVCNQSLWSVSTQDNPSLEYPSGGRELLVLSASGDGSLVTRSNWRVTCLGGASGGFQVNAPDGTSYVMDVTEAAYDETSWHTRLATDRNGNTITLSYQTFPSGQLYLARAASDEPTITTSDGREVFYRYDQASELLSEIEVNGQVWQYRHTPLPNTAGGYFHLTEVVRPDGLSWKYEYNPDVGGQPGQSSLSAVVNPYGARTEYGYQSFIAGADLTEPPRTIAIASKTVTGRDLTSGNWTFTFEPGSYAITPGRSLDVTTVTSPSGVTKYFHYGYEYARGSIGALWTVGLLYRQETYGLDGQLLETQVHGWEPRLISYENFWHGRDLDAVDEETNAALHTVRWTERGGSAQALTSSDFDELGNPGTVRASSNTTAQTDLVAHHTYLNDSSRWLIGLPLTVTLEDVGSISNSYDARGNKLSETRFGVTTSYTYTAEGDLATRTDATGATVTYSDHYRSTPRREVLPDGVTLQRTVNPTGTIASQINGRGFQKTFTHDALNRLVRIDYPTHASVTAVWGQTGRTVTRGSAQEELLWDGMGQSTQVTRRDLGSTQSVTRTMRYDAAGRKVFESYPGSTEGDTFSFDALDRAVRVEHADGTFLSRSFQGNAVVEETNERGVVTSYLFQSYGHPDQDRALLMTTTHPAPDAPAVVTLISKNKLNQPTQILQGSPDGTGAIVGYARSKTYDSLTFLAAESNPETGTTSYGRDAVGRTTSLQVGTSDATRYAYDALGRLTSIDYPGATPDVTTTYDENGNPRVLSNDDSVRTYTYDANDNLTAEEIAIGDQVFHLSRGFDELDHPASLTYPSGRVIDHAPDAFGRPTRAGGYISQVQYHPTGAVSHMEYGNGQVLEQSLSSRGWLQRTYTHGATSTVDLAYTYDAIGNPTGILNAVDSTYNRALTYDQMDRLTAASGSWGSASFAYDANGNLTGKTVGASVDTFDHSGMRLDSVSQPYRGETRSMSYDARGNLGTEDTVDAFLSPRGQRRFSYDDANHLRGASRTTWQGGMQSSESFTYGYDGAGFRVAATSSAGTTRFVYGSDQRLLGEYTGAATYGKEYIYVGAQRVASAKTNEGPAASAGADQTTFTGTQVTLDGSGSRDPEGGPLTYAWAQLSGTAVTLAPAGAAGATFTAPTAGDLSFALTVTDDEGASATATVTVVVKPNTPPVASAGPDQTIVQGALVALDGSGSGDSEGAITYRWQQTAGPSVSLSDATAARPTFTPPTSTTTHPVVTFDLTVTDLVGATATDSVSITCLSQSADTDGDGLPDLWEWSHFGGWTLYGAGDDPDHDGFTNLQEYQEGSDPQSATSVPPPFDARALPGNGRNVISWDLDAQASRYDLYWSNSPNVTDAAALISSPAMPYLHTDLISDGRRYYYRVRKIVAGAAIWTGEVHAAPGQPAYSMRDAWPQDRVAGATQASNAKGERVFVWSAYNGSAYELRALRQSLGGPQPVVVLRSKSTSFAPIKVDMSQGGSIVVLWREQSGTRYDLWSSVFRPSAGWTSSLVETYNGDANQPGDVEQIGGVSFIGKTESALAVWTQDLLRFDAAGHGNLVADVYYSVLAESGATWGSRYDADVALSGESFSHTWVSPRVAADDSGHVVLCWVRQDYANTVSAVAARVYDPSSGWTASTLLSAVTSVYPTARKPVCDLDAAGNATVIWRQSATAAPFQYAERSAASGAWSSATTLGGTSSRATLDDPSLVMNGAGHALLTWREGTQPCYRRRLPGSAWGSPLKMGGSSNAVASPLTVVMAEALANPTTEPGDAFAVWSYNGNAWIWNASDATTVRPIDTDTKTASEYAVMDGVWLYRHGVTLLEVGWSINGGATMLAHDWTPPPPNAVPVANAGPDQTANELSTVSLDGSGSADADGGIVAWSWTQTGGPAVTLAGSDTAQPSFTAPQVTGDQALTFQLVVTDDGGAQGSDTAVVTVHDLDPDVTPPVTTLTKTRTVSHKIASFSLTLAISEPATRYFRVTGQGSVTGGGASTTSWQTYSGPVSVKLNSSTSTASFDYYSVDTAGNVEATRTEVLQ